MTLSTVSPTCGGGWLTSSSAATHRSTNASPTRSPTIGNSSSCSARHRRLRICRSPHSARFATCCSTDSIIRSTTCTTAGPMPTPARCSSTSADSSAPRLLDLLEDAASADQRLRPQRTHRTRAHVGVASAGRAVLPRRRRSERRNQSAVRSIPDRLRRPRRDRPDRLTGRHLLRGDRRRTADRRMVAAVRRADRDRPVPHRSHRPVRRPLVVGVRVARHRPSRSCRGVDQTRPTASADADHRSRQPGASAVAR